MLRAVNLGDIVRRDAPAHQAFIDLREPAAPRVWTSRELDEGMNAVARGLLARGLGRGDRIAILSANRAEFLLAYGGLMRAGMVPVPINHRLAAETITFILADCGARAALADAERRVLIPPGLPVYRIDEADGPDGFGCLTQPGPFDPVRPAAGELAKILYTSGSTGRPKGVPLDHQGQLWALRHFVTAAAEGLAERTVIVAPAYHKNGLFFSMVALANGFTIVSLPRFESRSYLEAVARYRCTLLTGIPTMFALVARETDLLERLDLSSVRTLTIGSAPLTDALIDRVQAIFPNATITNGYGTTEAGPSVFGPHPAGLPRPPLSLGHPLADIEWRLSDGETADQGVLELKTPALMAGYLNLPEVTAEKIRDGWYVTGDVMRRDADGFFYFVSRADDMFVCGGENVYPGEVEKLLERCPGVAQAAVVPVPDEIKGQIPVAFVVLVAGAGVTAEMVRSWTLENGPAFSHPRFVLLRDRLPVAGTHKIDRAGLAEAARRHAEGRRRG